MIKEFSIIIPAYNEESAIANVITDLLQYIATKDWTVEMIVVNDNSTDKTSEILKQFGDSIKVINHPYNKGYGASIKTGIRNARHNWVLTFDGDGQYKPNYIDMLVEKGDAYDMISGSRTVGYKGPLLRRPGKNILRIFAEYLVQEKIPDLNCGLRLARRDLLKQYFHILPDGFSLTATSLLTFLKDGLNVCFVPVEMSPRIGRKSTVALRDGFGAIMLMVRAIMLFSPLRVFLPISIALFLIGFGSLIYDIWSRNIADTTVLFLMTGLLIFFFGLLADQIAAIRRQIKDR